MTHVYSDGSALNAVEQARYGLTIQYPDAIAKTSALHADNVVTTMMQN